MTNELGRQIGRFRLLDVLGSGGFATVYRAEDTQLGREVAFKLLHPHLADDEAFRRRFMAEARAAARLHHANIVAIHEVGVTDDGRPYIVMPLLEGTLLSAVIAHRAPLPFSEASSVLSQLAAALDYLHRQGLVHRDLKPANVMISSTGEVTLMDFGIARSAEEQARLTQTGQVVGTPTYMAPEQISGDETGPAGDIYSLAILAYELFAGRPPFTGNPTAVMRAQIDAPPPPIAGFNPSVPPSAALAIDRALAKDPAARPATAGAFVSLLAGDSATEVFSRPPVPRGAATVAGYPSVVVGPRPYPWAILASAIVALAIIALLLLVFVRRGNGSSPPTATVTALQPAGTPTALSAIASPSGTPAATPSTPPPATATVQPTATPSPRPTPTPTPTPAPTATPAPTPSPSPSPTQTADSRVTAVLSTLRPPASAAFVDVDRNVAVRQAGQTPILAGDTALLLLGEATEEALQQRRLSADQQFTIQPADVAAQTGALAGQVGRTISVRNLLQTALVDGDPTAANILIRAVGGLNAVNAEAQRLGLNQTRLTHAFGSPVAAGAPENTTSTGDLSQLMSEVAGRRGIDPTSANDLLGILRLRQTQSPSVAGSSLPPGSVVAGIDSNTSGTTVSVALLSLPTGSLGAFSVAVPGNSDAAGQTIASAARQVVQAFSP